MTDAAAPDDESVAIGPIDPIAGADAGAGSDLQRASYQREPASTAPTSPRTDTTTIDDPREGLSMPVTMPAAAIPGRGSSTGGRLGSTAMEFLRGGFGPEAVPYLAAWERQREIHASVVEGTRDDTIWLLEHPPVFTCGKRTDPHERPLDPGGAEVIDVDRGGKITFHGPGQLVGYPIVRLAGHVLVVDYVRRVEEALIRTCADFGIAAARVPGRAGVWLRADERGPERKIAAIGIRVARGVAMHGFALNCDVDLTWYDRFVPCGIADAGVTSLSVELDRDVTVAEVLPTIERHLTTYLAWEPFEPTPDYDPKPEPPRHLPRIELVRP